MVPKSDNERIVITGVGLTAPNGNTLSEYRNSLLKGISGIKHADIRYMGPQAVGYCDFDEFKYQKKKARRRGTRSGSIAIYCSNEALNDSGIEWDQTDRSRVGVFLGITEHGNVETEEEIYQLSQNDYDTKLWSHHHNPRTVSNSPAGEVTLNLSITGPHYTIGSACAGGNMGPIQALQMLRLGEVDFALAGGVSESAQTFGIFAAFKSQGALGHNDDPAKASLPLNKDRNGIVISEGGCVYAMERLSSAKARGAKIYGEIVGHGINSDATDFVLPNTQRQIECMNLALNRAGVNAADIDIVNMHATGTMAGDIAETKAVRGVFDSSDNTYINCTKGFIGHCMGAAGALELAGNLPSFDDQVVHHCLNADPIDPECELKNLVMLEPKKIDRVEYILNSSFGMLGINSVIIVKKSV